MKHLFAVAGAAGALLIPSSSSPDNAKLQRQIVSLQHQTSQLRCAISGLDLRIQALEQGKQPGPGAPSTSCPP